MPTFRTDWDTEPNPAYDIWTSVNGSEVLPGIISPLVATTFNRYDHRGLKKLMSAYPAGKSVKHFPPPVGNFFGVVAGRLVLNNGYSVAAMSSLDPQIAQAILGQFFTGATGGERFVVKTSPAKIAETYALATAQRAEAPATLAANRERFYAERASEQATKDLALDLRGAWNRFNELAEENGGDIVNTHYVVSVAAGEFQVRLAGVLAMGGSDPNLVVPLCSSLGEVESSKPAIALYELARLANRHDDVVAGLEDDDAATVLARLAAPPSKGWKAFAKAFEEFLFTYGYRVQGELDPSVADWSERPAFALSQVRSMLHVPEADSPKASIKRGMAERRALEKSVRKGLPAELRGPFDEVLAQAQHFTRLRELSKATWVLGVRRSRPPYLALCRNLAEAKVVRSPDDVKFLTWDEVDALAKGKKVDDVAGRIARRKRQAKQAESYQLPDNWVGIAKPVKRKAAVETTTLTGLGVSLGSGPVTGVARIIPSAEAGLARDIEPGEILVAPFTDAPWTPLFIPAGAVVVETGGVLSHAATVAREFGIPAVVMCKDATRLIRDGDRVTVDGATGTVTIVARA